MSQSRGHLLLRIFLTYLMTAASILGSVAVLFFSFQSPHELPATVEKNLAAYLGMLQERLESNPTRAGLEAIKNDLGLLVRTDQNAASADQLGLPSFAEIEADSAVKTSSVAFGRVRKFVYAFMPQAKLRAVWFIPLEQLPRRLRVPFATVAAVLLTILAISFMTIRMIMSPIKVLLEGVAQLSKGNLNYRIHSAYRSEFQVIAQAFNRMADQLEKLIATKERLLRDVSHELRSPLTRINVASDLLENPILKNQIKSDVKKMDQMLFDLLESYRIRDGATKLKLAQVNLREFFESIVSDYRSSTIPISFSIGENIDHWVFDPFQIERVVRNLIENAIKYANASVEPIRLEIEKSDESLVLKVIDQGQGISQNELSSIFDPFYRSDRARSHEAGGFGLGLSICKAIVEAHGGSIAALSQLTKGSAFTISLPELKSP